MENCEKCNNEMGTCTCGSETPTEGATEGQSE